MVVNINLFTAGKFADKDRHSFLVNLLIKASHELQLPILIQSDINYEMINYFKEDLELDLIYTKLTSILYEIYLNYLKPDAELIIEIIKITPVSALIKLKG